LLPAHETIRNIIIISIPDIITAAASIRVVADFFVDFCIYP